LAGVPALNFDGVQKERNMETNGLTDALIEHIVLRKACENPVTTFFRSGPFTAMPDEKWMDGDIAFARDRGMLSIIDRLVTQFAASPQPGVLDSLGFSALAEAMHALAANGWYRITDQAGRRVFAERLPDRIEHLGNGIHETAQ